MPELLYAGTLAAMCLSAFTWGQPSNESSMRRSWGTTRGETVPAPALALPGAVAKVPGGWEGDPRSLPSPRKFTGVREDGLQLLSEKKTTEVTNPARAYKCSEASQVNHMSERWMDISIVWGQIRAIPKRKTLKEKTNGPN